MAAVMSGENNQTEMRGKVIVLSGPSGVGKSTICREVVRRIDNVRLSVSATTRPPGPGEQSGRDYWFISRAEFERRIADGLLLESAEVFGNLYGTPKDKVDEELEAGRTVILEIDVQGGKQVRAVYPDAVMIFILPPSEKTLAERLNNRGRDTDEVAQIRLEKASNEIAEAWRCYEHMVINEDLDHAIDEVVQIITQALGKADDSGAHDGTIGE
jgi:guanylate kinase